MITRGDAVVVAPNDPKAAYHGCVGIVKYAWPDIERYSVELAIGESGWKETLSVSEKYLIKLCGKRS